MSLKLTQINNRTILLVDYMLHIFTFLLKQVGHQNAADAGSDRDYLDLSIISIRQFATRRSELFAGSPTVRSSTVLRTRSGIVYVPSVCPIL